MELQLIKPSKKYKKQIIDMLDEWNKIDEAIVPCSVNSLDYHDFDNYINDLDVIVPSCNHVISSTYFCLDSTRDIIVGAISIRHYLNEKLLLFGGHIGDGVRPSERKKGIATQMIHLALEECKKLGITRVLMTCSKDNVGSAKSIQNNGGKLENEVIIDGIIVQRYWIENT